MVTRTRSRSAPRSLSQKAERRSRNLSRSGYPWGNWYQTGITAWAQIMTEEMVDQIDKPPYPDHYCNHYRWRCQPPRLIGNTYQWSNKKGGLWRHNYRFNNYHVGIVDDGWQWSGHLATHMSTNPDDYVNDAIARANPAASAVDLGEFIGELRDLPFVIIPRKLRQLPIWYLFGVLPFLNDIMELTRLSDSIDQRMQLLRSLQGRTKKRRHGHGTALSRDHRIPASAFGLLLREEKETSVRAWSVSSATIHYDKLKPPPKYDTSYVRKLLLSETPFVTAWNLMPWSWLIDYFVDVDGMLRAYGNQVPGYELLSLLVCVEEKTSYQIKVTGVAEGWKGHGRVQRGKFERLNFRRKVYPNPTPRPPTVWPILSNRQLGNLAALGLALSANTKGFR